MNEFLSMIMLWPLDWAPRGWAACIGQQVTIADNQALYALIGTKYGGNATTYFNLPDFRGRVPIGFGQGPGLSQYLLAEKGGVQAVSLMPAQVPSIPIKASAVSGTETTPGSNNATTLAASNALRATASNIYNNQTPTVDLNTGAQGGNQPHENRQPFLAVNYIMSMQGVFPPRN